MERVMTTATEIPITATAADTDTPTTSPTWPNETHRRQSRRGREKRVCVERKSCLGAADVGRDVEGRAALDSVDREGCLFACKGSAQAQVSFAHAAEVGCRGGSGGGRKL